MSQHQHHPNHEDKPLDVDPAHVMPREKHTQREHYERMARDAAAQPEK